MSLSSLLVKTSADSASKSRKDAGRNTNIDSGLDALFKSTASSLPVRPSRATSQQTVTSTGNDDHDHKKKRKRKTSDNEEQQREDASDRLNRKRSCAKKKTEEKGAVFGDDEIADKKILEGAKKAKSQKDGVVSSKIKMDVRASSPIPKADLEGGVTVEGEISENDSDQESTDGERLVHETLLTKGKGKRKVKGKSKTYVPADETSEQRNKRTIFVGNLSVEVAQKKPVLKKLRQHILSQVPSAKIESIRFRSVPFQIPTSKLPEDDSKLKKAGSTSKEAKTRDHDRERTSAWKERQKDDDALKAEEKVYLNPNQKKKIAFINQEFHSTANTINAYIVFAHPPSLEARPTNLPPLLEVMDPYEAAVEAVKKCDGTIFMERIIRVDLLYITKLDAESGKVSAKGKDINPKLCVFVGNLDFESKEEDLRVFFEGLLSGEKGAPSSLVDSDRTDEEDDEDSEKIGLNRPRTWVTRVRIIRDKDTQLGKGFAYVQFLDRGCVDEVLAMDQTRLKFAKRKLRVQRCKSLPCAGTKTSTTTFVRKSAPTMNAVRPRPIIPRGDPSLGAKLAHLPKEERKQLKSEDADRVARRIAKKKARMALSNSSAGARVKGKERARVRKVGSKVFKPAGGTPVKKGRVRSERSLFKINAKK